MFAASRFCYVKFYLNEQSETRAKHQTTCRQKAFRLAHFWHLKKIICHTKYL